MVKIQKTSFTPTEFNAIVFHALKLTDGRTGHSKVSNRGEGTTLAKFINECVTYCITHKLHPMSEFLNEKEIRALALWREKELLEQENARTGERLAQIGKELKTLVRRDEAEMEVCLQVND